MFAADVPLAGVRPRRVDARHRTAWTEPRSASIDSAAAMSAARASRSAPRAASAATAVDGCVPLMSASPSFGSSVTGSSPAARERVARRTATCVPSPTVASPSPISTSDEVRERREVAAGADRAAARHARVHAAVEQLDQPLERASGGCRRNPSPARCARSAIDARTARTGSGSPTPAAWLRSRFSWSAPSASRGIAVSASAPKPVLMP